MYEEIIEKKCKQAFHVALIERLGIPDNAWVGLMVVDIAPANVDGKGKEFLDVVRDEIDAGTSFPECLVEYACAGYERQRARINGSNLADNVTFKIPEDHDSDLRVYAIGFFADKIDGEPEFVLAMSRAKTFYAGDNVTVELAIN